MPNETRRRLAPLPLLRQRIAAALPALLIATAALLPLAAEAAPAPWYQWRSKLNNQTICAQASPGPGWERERNRGPYTGNRCDRLLPPHKHPAQPPPDRVAPGQGS